MKFIGNQKIISRLQNSLQSGKLNHAYLLSGPENLGKFTLAKMFALSAIADKKMPSIIDVANKDAMLDLIVVEPEIIEKKGISKQRDISVEQIREAKLNLSLFPYHGKYKVLIINDAHKLNVAAQNALLKILEEPNLTTIIMLIVHEYERILPTIISRCQVLNFSLVEEIEMREFFSELETRDLAMGRPGLANILQNNSDKKQLRQDAKHELACILMGTLSEKFSLAEEYSKNIVKTLVKLNVWIWQLRKNALQDSGKYLENFIKIEKIQNCLELLKRTNSNSRLLLETLFIDL